MVVTAMAVGSATAIAVALYGGSYALWVDDTAVSVGDVESGTLALTVASAFTPSLWSNLVVGEAVRQPFTVTNTGTVDMTLSGSALSASSGYEIRAIRGTCPSSAIGGTAATVSAIALGTLAAGASATVCLEVAVTAAASASTSSAFTLTVTGTQAP
jgi:hypothetical protein